MAIFITKIVSLIDRGSWLLKKNKNPYTKHGFELKKLDRPKYMKVDIYLVVNSMYFGGL